MSSQLKRKPNRDDDPKQKAWKFAAQVLGVAIGYIITHIARAFDR
jgi:hypothetical protein